jgi:two-component system response regulator PilR (NtrC family)
MARLVDYRYPGNVRELENVIERAVALCRGEVIDLDSLPQSVLNPAISPGSQRIPSSGIKLEELLDEYEKGLLLEALKASGGVKKHAAQLVGVSFRSFRYRLEKLGLDHPSENES